MIQTPQTPAEPETIEIPLTQGFVAIIDAADAPLVAGYSWHVYNRRRDHTQYATAWVPGSRPRRKVAMHTLLTGEKRIDHKDGNGLNNTRDNMRPCTQQQNMRNTRKRKSGSQFKGVTFQMDRATQARPWLAQIKGERKRNLGRYATEVEAAKAYDAAAKELFGEFAKLNFPQVAA